jgi:putative transposase
MSRAEKRQRVEESIRLGYPVGEVCRVFETGRAGWYRRKGVFRAEAASIEAPQSTISSGDDLRDGGILGEIRSLVAVHPFWGYRRVHAHLKHRSGYRVNRKRVYRLMKESGLLEKVKRFKPERPWKKKPTAERPNQYWGTDMTKFLISGLGWACLVIVEDWFHRQVIGDAIGLRGDTTLWLEALNEAVQTAFAEEGPRGQGVQLISDNGSQPTSRRYRGECKTLGVDQIFTTYDNPKGNAETERLIRTLKEEAIWPYEFKTLEEAKEKITQAIRFYNERYCHSALGYKSPTEFLREYLREQTVEQAA